MTKNKKLHRAWLVLVASILFQGATTGIMFNCLGLFYSSICQDLGFSMGGISLYATIRQLATAAAMPFMIRLLKKKNMHWYLLLTTLVCSLSFGLFGAFHHLYEFYIIAVVTGISGSIVFAIPITIMINNWFHSQKSLALGIAFSASGVFGAIMNPICSAIILQVGWRGAAWIMMGISLAMTVPSILFVLRRAPEDLGMKPFGAEIIHEANPLAVSSGQTLAPERTRSQFLTIMISGLIITGVSYWLSQYNSHLATYGRSMGLDLMAASTVASFAMVGNVVSKILLGWVGDHFGYKTATFSGLFLSAMSFVVFILFGQYQVGLYAGGFLFGFTMAMATIVPSMLASNLYSKEEYETQYGRMSTVGYLASAIGFLLIGTSFDMFGSYLPSMGLALGLCVLAAIAGLLITRLTAAKKQENT